MTDKCATCKFWIGDLGDVLPGVCIRHAPLATGGLYGPVETRWPSTGEDCWCGDHEPKELAA